MVGAGDVPAGGYWGVRTGGAIAAAGAAVSNVTLGVASFHPSGGELA